MRIADGAVAAARLDQGLTTPRGAFGVGFQGLGFRVMGLMSYLHGSATAAKVKKSEGNVFP